jgi:small subunit ribosomal protein S18
MAFQSDRPEIENRKFVDYKDVAYLRQFTNPHAKIVSRKRSGVQASRQREVTLAIKRARFMALMPYLAA